MKCKTVKGIFIPGCLGAAFACGCGKTLSEIKSFCTCKDMNSFNSEILELEKRVKILEDMMGYGPRRMKIEKNRQSPSSPGDRP
jgi:hypothetical protein